MHAFIPRHTLIILAHLTNK